MKDRETDVECTAAYLAAHIPDNTHTAYRGIRMEPEEIAERRSYMRRKLVSSRFCNKTNDELDRSIYYEADGHKMLEDEKGCCYVLKSTMKPPREAEFRKARAMIPFEYMGLSTHDFKWDIYQQDTTKTKDTLNRYLMGFEAMREKGMGLYIYSATKGSGKTMLSCCLLNELANRYAVSVKFVNVLDLLDMTKKSYAGSNMEVNAIRDAAVLVLDDIGVQMSREWVDTVFYQLVNQRYNEHRVTFYTSNVKIDSLKMDERTKDRIEAASYMVKLPDVPVRRNQSAKEKEELLKKIKMPNEERQLSKGQE